MASKRNGWYPSPESMIIGGIVAWAKNPLNHLDPSKPYERQAIERIKHEQWEDMLKESERMRCADGTTTDKSV